MIVKVTVIYNVCCTISIFLVYLRTPLLGPVVRLY